LVRIMRVQRDIPSSIIEAGVDKSNLRQLVQERLGEQGKRCRCIRCREVGRRNGVEPDPEALEIVCRTYAASGGIEEFISVEDKERDVLVAFLRLRIPSEAFRPEVDADSAFVRELHVYGQMVPVGESHPEAWQHRGWGGALMSEAERIAFEDHGARKLLVMSALGTKHYYERLATAWTVSTCRSASDGEFFNLSEHRIAWRPEDCSS